MVLTPLLLFTTVALAEVMVRSVRELETDDAVQYAAQRYRVFASAYIVVDKCARDYVAIADAGAWVKEQFAAAEVSLRKAYHDAYLKRVGYPPDVPTEQEYVARIRGLQQKVVNNAALSIQNQGCHEPAIQNIVEFVIKSRQPAVATPEEN